MSGLARYRRVLAAPHVMGLLLASLLARLPVGINGLAIVLFMREHTGSFAAAGAATGGYALGLGLSAPIEGRLIDRHGPRAVVPPIVAIQVVSMLAFVLLGISGSPAGVLIALATVAGFGAPPWSAIMRAMWSRLLSNEQALVDTAFALDAAIVESVFVVGPALTGAATAIFSPQIALLVSVAAITAGSLFFIRSRAVEGWEIERHSDRNPLGALRVPGLRTVVLGTLPIGFAFGALEIAIPAFASHHGSPSTAGLLVAVWAIGSATGAIVYGAREWRRPLGLRWVTFAALFAAGSGLLLAAPTVLVSIPLLLAAGVFIAPTIASGSQLLGVVAPAGMGTEAYAWGPTAIVAGSAAGSAVAGALAETAGWRAATAAAVVAAILGAIVAYARRETLTGGPAAAVASAPTV